MRRTQEAVHGSAVTTDLVSVPIKIKNDFKTINRHS